MARKLPPIHPGEILKETLDDLGISMNRLAQAPRVPANRISAIVAGSVESPGRAPCVWLATSTPHRTIGSTCSPSMI